ncbi:MAG: zinc ribbon domain-containing protein [Clostridia bacterium]|nr:zinc ribbon domain-containing protein [Clostridia bacterium]
MFCAKCGKELPEGATFCSDCGTQVGTSGKKSFDLPVGGFIDALKGFFKKGNQVNAVAGAYNDKSFIGIIVAVVSAVIFALSVMVNINQTIVAGVHKLSSRVSAGDILEDVPVVGNLFLALLAGVVCIAAAALIIFLFDMIVRKNKSANIFSAFNVAAIAFLPVTVACILNFVLGLPGCFMPALVMAIAVVFSLALYTAAFKKIFGIGEHSFIVSIIPALIIAVLAVVFITIVVSNCGEYLFTGLSYFFAD